MDQRPVARRFAWSASVLLLCIPFAAALEQPQGGTPSESAGENSDGTATPPGDAPWWTTWSRDADRDGIDEELVWRLAHGEPEPVRVIVDYDRRPAAADEDRLRAAGGDVVYAAVGIDSIIADVPRALLPAVRALPGVVMLEANDRVTWTLDSAVPAVAVDSVWNDTALFGDGVVAAVVDSGADGNHTGLNDLDDVNATVDRKIIAFYDAADNPDNQDGTDAPYDRQGHGSHVSGILAGTGSGSPDGQFVGVAPQAMLVVVRVGDDSFSQDVAIKGIDWVITSKSTFRTRILSMSFGAFVNAPGITNDGNSALSREANAAVDAGLVTIVAAGNNGPRRSTIAPPGDAVKVITVGNVNDDHTLNPSSSRGPVGRWPNTWIKPDVCAPGTSITSVQANSVDKYEAFTGTSMSAPFIAGVSALILQAAPALSADEVKLVLQRTADGNEAYPLQGSPNNDYGFGVVNPMEAVENVTAGAKPPKVTIDPPGRVKGTATIRGTASVEGGTIANVEVRIGAGDWVRADGTTSWSYRWDTLPFPNGAVKVFARSSDGADYSGTASATATVDNLYVKLDGMTGPVNGIYTLSGSAVGTGIQRVEVAVDGGAPADARAKSADWSSWSYELDGKTLKDGHHKAEVRARTSSEASAAVAHHFETSGGSVVSPNNTTKPKQPVFIPAAGPPATLVALGLAALLVAASAPRRRPPPTD